MGGLAVGVSGFSSESNHSTYLPPALHYLDPDYLSRDWWLAASIHYHYAFFALAVVLAKLGILEVGLAVLNIALVSAGIYAFFRILAVLRFSSILATLALLIGLLLMTRAYFSAGGSYLFSPSLQASTIATTATLFALATFLEGRKGRCGLWLALAGLFHVNFLIVNIVFFGLCLVLLYCAERGLQVLKAKDFYLDVVRLFGPSLLVLCFSLPLVLSIADDPLPPAEAVKADWIFFRFAVPFHYYPLSYLRELIELFSWQVMGALWTAVAIPDVETRRKAWAIQAALALAIWSATTLTTVVFIAPVSRLYLWRLAPFAVMFAAMLVLAGTVRCLGAGTEAPRPGVREWAILLLSFCFLRFLAVPFVPVAGQILSTSPFSPAPFLLGALFFLVALQWVRRVPWRARGTLVRTVLAATLLAAFLTQPSDGLQSRYTLLRPASALPDDQAMFRFVRTRTPRDAIFIIPPNLDYMRLVGRRATVVDLKGMPMNGSGLIEWYTRLEDVAGVDRPVNWSAVVNGFAKIDERRLEVLRRKYGAEFAVLGARQALAPTGWHEIYRNRSFKVLAYRFD
jgi:hypothetical protein